MRLGIDVRALQCSHRGRGIGRYTSSLLHHLSEAAQEDLWLFYFEGQEGIGEEAGEDKFHLAPITLPWGLRATSVKIATSVSLPLQAWRQGIEVMLFPQGIGAEAACAIPRRLSCPFIMVVHDLIPLLFPEHYPEFAGSAVYQAQCQLLNSAEAIIADSECTKTSICSHLGVSRQKIKVVYPGVDSMFRPMEDMSVLTRVWAALGISPPYFLSVGGYDWRKNLSTTLRAFACMKKQSRADHRLVIVDNRLACPQETLELIERLGIWERVIFTGAVEDEDLRALYSGAQALVFPSFYEGFGLPALEAMACGTPVICSRGGALPEVGWEAALYVEPEDAEGLAAHMLRVAEEPELSRELSAEGKARAANFSWRTAAAEILSLCREAAGVSESVKA
jgi:glycosyltransferase involved in cell wall biosynthesis